ncbi:hypothetical protein ACEUZ9_005033 [Paracoccus litorisediminis]|jgi:hypothetical protein|uniref:DUF2497 domain-containing protein n=1 Tax=Paracoccus litorisediminis TaxID=2006130 RepID=A0A844HJB9_9RHOB|nr:hypothetical protein [Paracoccus litorisediminis]MTH59108.1 hypothetical protein [Paracoccus litorisediminis]
MQHDLAGRGAQAENVGDVLASIRRLIAQDQVEGDEPSYSYAAPLNSRAGNPPLILARQDLVPVPAESDLRRIAANAPVPLVEEPALTPEEEVEFAEAEAALARMTSLPRLLAADPVQIAPDSIAAIEVPEELSLTAFAPELSLPAEQNLFADVMSAQPDLRETVRAVLREELSGETGLQISHQLRQLVRLEVESLIREIYFEG